MVKSVRLGAVTALRLETRPSHTVLRHGAAYDVALVRLAVTEYRLLKSANGLSLVECRLLTGRTHQIRAQMAHAGWPLLGDASGALSIRGF